MAESFCSFEALPFVFSQPNRATQLSPEIGAILAGALLQAFASGHTASNTPDPIRTRKLSGARPGQYWGGGPPGKPLGCCWLIVTHLRRLLLLSGLCIFFRWFGAYFLKFGVACGFELKFKEVWRHQ